MSRNADEFGDRYRDVLAGYANARQELNRQRARFTSEVPDSPKGVVDNVEGELLEAHVRALFVDGLLEALGWSTRLGPNSLGRVLVEQPNRRTSGGTVKFMDYCGLERETDRPLLIVETKRPGAGLPTLNGRPPTYGLESEYASVLAKGLVDPSALGGEWQGWIVQVTGYVRSTHERTSEWPMRVAITNGDWMIVFETPDAVFSGLGEVDASRIRVIPRLDAANHVAPLLFQSLAYSWLSAEIAPVSPPELPFRISREHVDRVTHGLRVTVGTKGGKFKVEPTVYVQPIIFLRIRGGAWFRVQEPGVEHEVELPHDPQALRAHLMEVEHAARTLLAAVNHYLGSDLVPVSLEEHYSDAAAFRELKGFSRRGDREFEVVTGAGTHYLLEQPRVTGCPYHDWQNCQRDGQAATKAAILRRSASPKSFFCSSEEHHCSHRATWIVKEQPLTAGTDNRFGARSGEEGQAFCELFALDHHLCCQACNFHGVCRRCRVFRLPCH